MFENLEMTSVCSLASSCMVLHTSLKTQLVSLINSRSVKQNTLYLFNVPLQLGWVRDCNRKGSSPISVGSKGAGTMERIDAERLLNAERIQIAALALLFTEPSEARCIVTECDALRPRSEPDSWVSVNWCAMTLFRISLRPGLQGHLSKFRYAGLLHRISRTWSLAEQAITFANCRDFKAGCTCAPDNFVRALQSPNDHAAW